MLWYHRFKRHLHAYMSMSWLEFTVIPWSSIFEHNCLTQISNGDSPDVQYCLNCIFKIHTWLAIVFIQLGVEDMSIIVCAFQVLVD